MSQTVQVVFYGDEQELPPLIATFILPANVEEEDVHIVISKALTDWKPLLDCPPERYAADAVCMQLGATVEFSEASQVYGVSSHPMQATQHIYLIVEFHSDENVVDVSGYASKDSAIEAWRNGYGTVDIVWDVIEEVVPDKYYRARSNLDMSNYYERTLVEIPIIYDKGVQGHVGSNEGHPDPDCGL